VCPGDKYVLRSFGIFQDFSGYFDTDMAQIWHTQVRRHLKDVSPLIFVSQNQELPGEIIYWIKKSGSSQNDTHTVSENFTLLNRQMDNGNCVFDTPQSL